jgi:FtsH-binding integral membrane protein
MNNPYAFPRPIPVAGLNENSRGRFISRMYNHLFISISVFTLIEIYLFKSGLAEPMAKAMLGTSWLLVLGGFMLVSWITRRMTHKAESKMAQYGALAIYVVAQSIIFVPLLWVANVYAPGTI